MTTNNVLDERYYDHVCCYFGIKKDVIEKLPVDIKPNLSTLLGPLSRPLSTIKEFLSSFKEEHDLVMKLIGISQKHCSETNPNRVFIRILGTDPTGQLEVSVPYRDNLKIGQYIHISGVKRFIRENGFPRIQLMRTGRITPLPFNLSMKNIKLKLLTPDTIDIKTLPKQYVTVKGIVMKKGTLESFRPNQGKGNRIYSLKLMIVSKDTVLDLYLNKTVAVDIDKHVKVNDEISLENVTLKITKAKVICYSSVYSTCQINPKKNLPIPQKLKFLYYPLEKTDLQTLQRNHNQIGSVVCFLTPFIERSNKRGTYYQAGITDGKLNGILSITEEQKRILGIEIDHSGTFKVDGLYHTKYENFKIDTERFSIINHHKELEMTKIIEMIQAESNKMVCLRGKLMEIKEKNLANPIKDCETIVQTKFVCSGTSLLLSVVDNIFKDKIKALELYQNYNILFVKVSKFNGENVLKITPFTTFQEV